MSCLGKAVGAYCDVIGSCSDLKYFACLGPFTFVSIVAYAYACLVDGYGNLLSCDLVVISCVVCGYLIPYIVCTCIGSCRNAVSVGKAFFCSVLACCKSILISSKVI